MIKQLISVSILIFLLILSRETLAVEIIHYDNKPITIQLKTGVERTILFGDHISIGIPRGVQSAKLFRAQSAQGALHILANKTFDKSRIQIRRMSDKHVILLDLISVEPSTQDKDPEDIKIVMPFEDKVDEVSDSIGSSHQPINVITPVDLTRYAAQRLYGPTRLHKEVNGISGSVITNKGRLSVFNLNDKNIDAHNVFAIEGGGYYLAAIHLRNTTNAEVRLDYLDINVPFSNATFQHHLLGPANSITDNTILYLIDDKPLKNTLYPWNFYQKDKVSSTQEGAK